MPAEYLSCFCAGTGIGDGGPLISSAKCLIELPCYTLQHHQFKKDVKYKPPLESILILSTDVLTQVTVQKYKQQEIKFFHRRVTGEKTTLGSEHEHLKLGSK